MTRDATAGVGVTFVDMFSVGQGGGEGEGGVGGGCVQQLAHLFGVVEKFAADAAAAAAAPAPPCANCCFIIDGIHELLMCVCPHLIQCKNVTFCAYRAAAARSSWVCCCCSCVACASAAAAAGWCVCRSGVMMLPMCAARARRWCCGVQL